MMTNRGASEISVPLLVGAGSTAALQVASGWWLNSGRGVGLTVIVLFALAALFGCARTGSRWTRSMALWVGAMTGLTTALWWIGPGTLWPIVWVVSSVITAGAVGAGSAAGWTGRSVVNALA